MKSIGKTKTARGLGLTFLLITTSMLALISAPVSADSARVTTNEDLTVSISDTIRHIERDSSFTVTILATNLDPASEYEVELSFCSVDTHSEWDGVEETYTHSCRDIEHAFDPIDIGSGNSFTTVVETIDDPGYADGLYNDTYLILGSLRIQGAPVTSNVTNVTNAFVLGGQAYNWNINGVSNVLIGSSLNLFGEVYYDTTDKYIDTYHVSCSIYAVGSNTPVITVDGTSTQLTWDSSHDFDISLPSPSTAGTHYLACDLIRESNSESMGTWTSENIQVIDEHWQRVHGTKQCTSFALRSV